MIFKRKSKTKENEISKIEAQKIFEFFTNHLQEIGSKILSDRYAMTNYDFDKYVRGAVFEYMLDLFNFKGFPQKVENKKFKEINSETLFHGYKNFEHGANFLCDNDYHSGVGITRGFFLTDDKDEALKYTAVNFPNPIPADENKILNVKILSDNFIGYDTLCYYRELLYDALTEFRNIKQSNKELLISQANERLNECVSEKDRTKFVELFDFLEFEVDVESRVAFMDMFTNNLSSIAIYLGYDYISCPKNLGKVSCQDGNFMIVLNRSALAVSESEYEKFCKNSTTYKDILPQKGE